MSRLLRARLVDVSGELALKGAGSLPGKATRLWKSGGSGLGKWESASGSALWCEPLSPEAEGIGPGPLPRTPHRLAAGCEASPGGPGARRAPAPTRGALLPQPRRSLLSALRGSPGGGVPRGTPRILGNRPPPSLQFENDLQTRAGASCQPRPDFRLWTRRRLGSPVVGTKFNLSQARGHRSGLLCPRRVRGGSSFFPESPEYFLGGTALNFRNSQLPAQMPTQTRQGPGVLFSPRREAKSGTLPSKFRALFLGL